MQPARQAGGQAGRSAWACCSGPAAARHSRRRGGPHLDGRQHAAALVVVCAAPPDAAVPHFRLERRRGPQGSRILCWLHIVVAWGVGGGRGMLQCWAEGHRWECAGPAPRQAGQCMQLVQHASARPPTVDERSGGPGGMQVLAVHHGAWAGCGQDCHIPHHGTGTMWEGGCSLSYLPASARRRTARSSTHAAASTPWGGKRHRGPPNRRPPRAPPPSCAAPAKPRRAANRRGCRAARRRRGWPPGPAARACMHHRPWVQAGEGRGSAAAAAAAATAAAAAAAAKPKRRDRAPIMRHHLRLKYSNAASTCAVHWACPLVDCASATARPSSRTCSAAMANCKALIADRLRSFGGA